MHAQRPPSVDRLARSLASTGLPHPLCVEVAREAIEAGDPESARLRASDLARTLLGPVINATGVLLHTNLGRAPWGTTATPSYTNLEFDLATGQRGSRQAHVGRLLANLCGAEAAIVVNNCAAAVLLALAGLAAGRGVAVSRGELVEIGGGFRVPDVLAQSGARLIEVGTTNRTRAEDYTRAVADPGADVALLLKVHRSNYRIVGFAESATVSELAPIGPPVLDDIGSGLLDAACPWLPGGPPSWLAGEPAARQTIEAGAGLVMFSGDKLLGGPQSGVIAGRSDLVAACARHPLARALRPGGLVLASLQDLLLAYLRRDSAAIPFWAMASRTVDELTARASAIGVGEVVAVDSLPGGGTLPGVTIPSAGLAIDGDHGAALRSGDATGGLAIVARVTDGRTELDLRTVDPAADAIIATALSALDRRP